MTRAVIPHVRARGGGSLVAVTTRGRHEPPQAMADAAVLLAGQDATGITGTVQRSEALPG